MPVQKVSQYEKGQLKLLNGSINWTSDTIRVLLLDTAHTVNLATHEFIADVVANEISDTDYNRLTDLTSRAVAQVGSNVEYDSDAASFGTTVTISARYLVVAKWITNDADSPLLWIVDLDGTGNVSSSNGIFRYTPSANGWLQVQPNQ